MLMGIDVGGTYTDGVLFADDSVVKSVKKPTDNSDLKATLLQVMDELLEGIDIARLRRIVLSTT
jgi:N-methylhydantoinase A/oxoprolinase/acetone carboxylase beta subunit